MTTFVFEFLNLYIPASTVYENDEYNICIEPTEIAEEFEEHRRDTGSDYQYGYWHTATCYIEASEERAKQLADWLGHIYSLAQNRDVTWQKYYSQAEGERFYSGRSMYTFSLDNTNIPLIRGTYTDGLDTIDEFVNTALRTLDEASEEYQLRLVRSLNMFLEGQGDTFWMIKFLLYWIVLESNANYNYDDYLQGPGEQIFTDEEIGDLQTSILNHLEEARWEQDHINHIEYILGQKHLYQVSSKTKIKIYLEFLDIGFDIEEIEEIIDMARSIRNPIVHRLDESRLMNNDSIVQNIRKIDFYVLLRLLEVDEEMQERLITPMIIGPDIERD